QAMGWLWSATRPITAAYAGTTSASPCQQPGHFRPVTDWPYEKGRPSAGGLDEESSNGSGSALRELEALAGARLTGLLALLLARVALEVAGLLEGGTQLRVHLLEGA